MYVYITHTHEDVIISINQSIRTIKRRELIDLILT